jgi:hypothetical protein
MSAAKNGYLNKIAIGQFYYKFTAFRNMMILVPGSWFRSDAGFIESRDSDASAGERTWQEMMLIISRTDYIIHTSDRRYTTNRGKRKQN